MSTDTWLSGQSALPQSSNDLRPRTALAWLVALFIFHVAVNGIYLSRENLPPSYDCANHLGITLRLYETWRHPGADFFSRLLEVSPYYPPLPHFVASLFFGIAGIGADSAHASLMVWMLILIVSVYESGRLLFDRLTGLFAAILISFFPIVFGLTRSFYPDLAVLALCSATWTCFLKSENLQRRRWSILFGICAGLAQMTKWTAFLFWLGPVFAWIVPQWLLLRRAPEAIRERDERFLHRLMGWYLFSFALFVIAFDLLARHSLRLGGDYLANLFMAALLFHGCLGAIWLLRHSSERLRAILIHASQNRNELRARMANLILVGLVALAICLPWYLRNGAFALKSTVFTATQDAALRGLPPITSPVSLLQYLFFLENHQLHLAFFLLFYLGLLLPGVEVRKRLFPLLFGLAAAYLAMTCIRLKDPRFTMPFLYLVALITAGGLVATRSKGWKIGWSAVVALLGVAQCLTISFGFGIPEKNFELPTPLGKLALFRPLGYGSFEKLRESWPNRDLVLRLAERTGQDRPIKAYTLVNHPAIHYEALNFIAASEGVPIHFEFPPRDASGRNFDARRTFFEPDALVVKRSGYIGPEFSVEGLTRLLGLFGRARIDNAFGFHRTDSFPLPDESWLDLWMREPHPNTPKEANYDLGGLGQLLGYRIESATVHRGETARLCLKMNLSDRLIEQYHFFIHLYNPAGEFMGSFGGPFPECTGENDTEFLFPIDTSRALSIGLGQVAVGAWDPVTGKRLSILDPGKGGGVGDILYLEAFIEILPESENAPKT